MLKLYKAFYSRLVISLSRANNRDPIYTALFILSLYVYIVLIQILIIIEIILGLRIQFSVYSFYLPLGIVIFLVNWFYFVFFKNTLMKESIQGEETKNFQGWKVHGIIFILFLIVIILVIIRDYLMKN